MSDLRQLLAFYSGRLYNLQAFNVKKAILLIKQAHFATEQ